MKKIIPLCFTLVMVIGSMIPLNAQTRKIVVEEGTGTWCSWCPRGTVYLDSLLKSDPDVIGIAVHGGDVMENSAYDQGSSFAAFPSGHISRSVKNQDVYTWFSSVASLKAIAVPASVGVSYTYNPSTLALDVTVTATFTNATTGNYRLGAIIVEDGIVGNGPSYDQSNSYSGGANGPMGGYENLPNPVPYTMMMYNHVGREVLGGYDGLAGTIPASVAANSTHSHTFNYTVPATFDPDYVYVVGVMIDSATGEILNADKSLDYISGISNAIPKFVSTPVTTGLTGSPYEYNFVARDPDNTSIQITSANLPSWLTLTDNGKGNGTISGNPTSSGTYTVTLTVSDGNSQTDQTFDIVVSQGSGINWTNVGTTGFPFSYQASYNGNDIAADNNGNIYSLIQSGSSGSLEVKQVDNNGNWNTLGSLNANNAYRFKITAAANGVYVLYNFENANYDSYNLQAHYFDGTSWSQIGSIIEVGDHTLMDIEVYNNEVYVLYADANYIAKLVKFDGTSWTQIGADIGSPLLRGILKFNSQGNAVAAFADYTNSNYIGSTLVMEYDGNVWNTLGSSLGQLATTTAKVISIAIDGNDNVYCAFSPYNVEEISVHKWDGSAWSTIGTNVSNGTVRSLEIETNASNELIVVYDDQLIGGAATARIYTNGMWLPLGAFGFSDGSIGYPSIAIDGFNNIPVVSFIESNQNDALHVMSYGEYNVNINEYDANYGNIAIDLYPNPVQDGIIYLSNEKLNEQAYSIYNMQGQKVQEGIVNGQEILISDQLANGIYSLKINQGVSTFSILK